MTAAGPEWLHGLSAAGHALGALAPGGAAALLAELRGAVAQVADEWVERGAAAKGWQALPEAAGEEWASGPLPVARFLAALADRFAAARSGAPDAAPIERRADGATRYRLGGVRGLCDPVLLRGIDAVLHAGPGSAATDPAAGGVALVLGAGNITSTPLLDALDQVFVRRRAVLLKLHPVHATLAGTFATALAPLIARGWLRLCCGAAELGAALARAPGVDAVHLTGSDRTWAALCADPRLARKALTGEVGCVTPAFVVPGAWHDAELRHVAAQLAAHCATNGGATCVAPRVVLTARDWPLRARFVAHLAAAFGRLPARRPFLAATRAQFAAATGGEPTGEGLPPTLRHGLDPARDAAACGTECFAPVLREFAFAADDAAAFCDRAAAFVRERCFGALSAYVFAPPRVLQGERAPLARAIERLPHGTVAINCWTGIGYGLGSTPWGVPPDAAPAHGRGFVRDISGVADVRRVVIRAPFRPRPLPPWLAGPRRAAATLRALTRHTLAPGAGPLLATIARGLVGG